MWRPYLVTAAAEAFDAALEAGGEGRSGPDGLVFLARQLGALGRDLDVPVSERGRARLLAALDGERNTRLMGGYGAFGVAGAGVLAGVRGSVRQGVLAAATVAGGGLVIAGAATGADPMTIVRSAVQEVPIIQEIPGIAKANPTAQPPVSVAVTLAGTVIGVETGQFQLSADGLAITVHVSNETRFRMRDGSPASYAHLGAGMAVAVSGERREGVVLAASVTMPALQAVAAGPAGTSAGGGPGAGGPALPGDGDGPAAALSPEPARETPTSTTNAPALRPSPTPAPVRTPIPAVESATPRPAVPTPVVTADERLGVVPTPSPTPVPTKTATASPTPTRTAEPTLTPGPTAIANETATPGPTKPPEPTPTRPKGETPTPAPAPAPSATATPTPAPKTEPDDKDALSWAPDGGSSPSQSGGSLSNDAGSAGPGAGSW
jgi:hypothetical protein